MPAVSTVWTRELSAARFGHAPLTLGTGGGGPAFVDASNRDACEFGFVTQHDEEVGAPPDVETPVLAPAVIDLGDALRVTHRESPDPTGDGPGDDTRDQHVIAEQRIHATV